MYLHNNPNLFSEVILGAAAEYALTEEFVAKDYFAMMFLKEVTARCNALVFKGGTCLSKCYDAINRFSEDVDLGIPDTHATEGTRKAIKRAVVSASEALGLIIANLDSTKSRREYNRYDFELPAPARSLIIETAIMTPASPYNIRAVQSIAGMFVESRDTNMAKTFNLEPFSVKANSLERTFVDKVFVLCDTYLQGRPAARQSRHIYDIWKLLPQITLDESLTALFETVREQRHGGYGNASANDGVNLASVLQAMIKEDTFKADYKNITSRLLYENAPYEEAVSALEITAKFLCTEP